MDRLINILTSNIPWPYCDPVTLLLTSVQVLARETPTRERTEYQHTQHYILHSSQNLDGRRRRHDCTITSKSILPVKTMIFQLKQKGSLDDLDAGERSRTSVDECMHTNVHFHQYSYDTTKTRHCHDRKT